MNNFIFIFLLQEKYYNSNNSKIYLIKLQVKYFQNQNITIVIKVNMGFWQNVEDECEYLGISRKELAEKAKFSVHTISNGIRRDGMPAADLALRISKALNISLEKLLDWNENIEPMESSEQIENQKLLLKYLPVLKKINEMNSDSKKAVLTIIGNLKQ